MDYLSGERRKITQTSSGVEFILAVSSSSSPSSSSSSLLSSLSSSRRFCSSNFNFLYSPSRDAASIFVSVSFQSPLHSSRRKFHHFHACPKIRRARFENCIEIVRLRASFGSMMKRKRNALKCSRAPVSPHRSSSSSSLSASSSTRCRRRGESFSTP